MSPNRTRVLVFLITALAVSFAHLLFLNGKRELVYDAAHYFSLGQRLAATGLFGFADELRTYGYPLFIALFIQVFGSSPNLVLFLIFNAQLAIYLSACFYAARFFKSVFKTDAIFLIGYAVTALNPFLLVYTPYGLTDLLSAVLGFLAIIWSVDPTSSRNNWRKPRIARLAFLSFFTAALDAIIRPANLSIVIAVAIIWLTRIVVFRNVPARAVGLMLIGLCIPVVPQVVNNYRAYQKFQPLIVQGRYSDQVTWGMADLKYGTLLIPGKPTTLNYPSPFHQPEIKTPIQFLTQQPLEYMFTLGMHLFALFDHDLLFPYATDLNPWYRSPLAILNFIFLFVSGYGALRWIRRTRARKRFDRTGLIFGGMTLAIVLYLGLYIWVAVEDRFSLPVYLWLTLLFVYGVSDLKNTIAQQRERALITSVFAGWVFICIAIFLSTWLRAQSPILLSGAVKPVCNRLAYPLDVYMEDQIQITGYAFEPREIQPAQSNIELILGWQYEPNYVDGYEFQVELMDVKGRAWSRGKPTPATICPTLGAQAADQNQSSFTFALAPTMPGGTYHIVFNLYKRKEDRFLNALDSRGKVIGTDLIIAELVIPKNTTSVTVNQLPMEHRLLVDLGEMRLLGDVPPRTTITPGEMFEVGLYWRARAKPLGDYMVVIELRRADGAVAFAHKSKPVSGDYPTPRWSPGEVLLDWHTFEIPSAIEPGLYNVYVGLQDASSEQRLGDTQISALTIVK